MAINRHLLHVKSNQTVTTTVDNEDVTRAKLPSPSNIEHGEIAINYHDGYETISIKNDNNEIVEFPNLNAVNTLINEAMSGAQDALTFDETPTENSTNPVTSEGIKEYVDTGDSIQSLTTYDTSTPLAVGDTHDEALSKLSKIIDDNETVVARALTELEDTKADKDDLYTKDEVDSLIEETNDSLTQIIEDNELTIATALNDLDSRISNMKGSIEELNEPSESTPLAVGDTYDDAFAKLTKIIRDDEEITARALTDLNETKQDEITDLDTIRSGAARGATALQSETQLSKGTSTGDGNVVTDIAVNNHQITLTMGLTALTENALKTVNSLSLVGNGNIDAEDVILGKLVEGSGALPVKNFYRFNGTYTQKPTDIVPSPDFSDTAETPNDKKIYVDILTQKIYWYTSNSGMPAGQRFKELCEVDLSSYADGAEYDSTEKKIYLKHGATRLSNPIDATDFIKDGMVNSVRIDTLDDGSSDDGSDAYDERYLIITFNTDAGMEDIEIPLSDIFDPNLYYTKEEIDEHELVTAAALTDLHNTKQDLLTFDSTPTANSTNPVTSQGIKTYVDSAIGNLSNEIEELEEPLVSTPLAVGDTYDEAFAKLTKIIRDNELATAGVLTDLHDTKQDLLTFDEAPTENSENPVTSDGIYTALDGKQDVLTFDDEPTEDSENPVTSGGVYDAINAIPEQLIDDVMVDQAYFEEHGANTFATANKRYNVLDVLELEDGVTYNVGAGCEIHFWNEGMLSGNEGESSILGLNNTLITGPMHKLFDDNVTFGGTMRNAECYPEWFGAVGDGVTDDADAINRCIYNAGYTPVVLNAMAYYVASSIVMTESGFNTYINTYLGYSETSWGRNQQFIARHNIIGAPTLDGPVLIVESNGSICKVNGAIAVQNTGDSGVGFSSIKTTGPDSGCQDMNIYIHGIHKGPKGDWYESVTTDDTYVSTWGVGHGTGAVLSSYGGYIVIDYIQGFEKGVHLARFYDTQLHVGQCEAIYCVYMGPVYGLPTRGIFVTRNKIFIGSQLRTQENYCKYIVDAEHSSVVREIGDIEIAMNEITVGDSNGAVNRRHPHKHSLYYTAGPAGHTGNKYNFNITYAIESARSFVKYEYASAPTSSNVGIGNGDIINFGVSCYLKDIDIPYGWNVKLNNVLVSNSAASMGSYRWFGTSGIMLIDTVTVSKASTPIWSSAAQTINILNINPQHKGNVIATDTIPATCENNKFYVVDNVQETITTNGTNKYPVYAKYFGTDATLIGYSLDNYKEKQDVLTFDSTPTANSTNPVTSGGVYTALSNINTDHLTEVTYSELKTIRDGDELVPGMFYRITDYQCTTTQANTQSADHQFDIVLLALSENKVAEEGWAMHHANDTYFANSNLSAWKVWYCLDNDTSRFAWADDSVDEDTPAFLTNNGVNYYRDVLHDSEGSTFPYAWTSSENVTKYTNVLEPSGQPGLAGRIAFVNNPNKTPPILAATVTYTPAHEGTGLSNGHGVIYRLIDEFNNDIKYDFKNIQFKRKITDGQYDENGTETWCYTLNVWYNDMCQDASIVGNTLPDYYGLINGVHDNNFGNTTAYDLYLEGVNTFAFVLGDNVVLSIDDEGYYGISSNTIGNHFYSNTFGNHFHYNTIGNHFYYNTIGNHFYYNTIGNNVNSNTIGNDFYSNTIGNDFYSNTIGNNFYYNTIGNDFRVNTIGDNFSYNTIGNFFFSNTIGNNFSYNTIGNNFSYNRSGNYFSSNTIGNNFQTNTIGTRNGNTVTTIDYVRYIRVEDGVQYVDITTTATTSSSAYLQNITISQGIAGTSSSRKTITHPTVGDTFKTTYQSANSQVFSI